MKHQLLQEAESMQEQLVAWRRSLHQIPREFDTLKCKKVPQSLEIGLFFCQIFIFIV